MKKIILLLSFALFALSTTFAQNPLVKQWDKDYGGNGTEGTKVNLIPTDNGGFFNYGLVMFTCKL